MALHSTAAAAAGSAALAAAAGGAAAGAIGCAGGGGAGGVSTAPQASIIPMGNTMYISKVVDRFTQFCSIKNS